MANNSNQGFLNTLFQWTVKSTAAEAAAASTTPTDVQPMSEEVSYYMLKTNSILIIF